MLKGMEIELIHKFLKLINWNEAVVWLLGCVMAVVLFIPASYVYVRVAPDVIQTGQRDYSADVQAAIDQVDREMAERAKERAKDAYYW